MDTNTLQSKFVEVSRDLIIALDRKLREIDSLKYGLPLDPDNKDWDNCEKYKEIEKITSLFLISGGKNDEYIDSLSNYISTLKINHEEYGFPNNIMEILNEMIPQYLSKCNEDFFVNSEEQITNIIRYLTLSEKYELLSLLLAKQSNMSFDNIIIMLNEYRTLLCSEIMKLNTYTKKEAELESHKAVLKLILK